MCIQIQYALIREYGTDRSLEWKPGGQINLIQCRDSEKFLLALAGLLGGLPENFFRDEAEYNVTADVLWTEDTVCRLGACFGKGERTVWVERVQSNLPVSFLHKAKAIHKQRFRNGTNTAHIFGNIPKKESHALPGEGDETLQRFQDFLHATCQRSLFADTRPLFLHNFLERLDEAVDLQPIFEALLATGRQVFIAVPHYYNIKPLEVMPYDIHTF